MLCLIHKELKHQYYHQDQVYLYHLDDYQKFEIVELSSLPDKRFFGAWEYTAGQDEKESQDLEQEFKVKYRQGGA